MGVSTEIRPECKVLIETMREEIKDIHEVVYKNGLVTQVSKNTDKLDEIKDNVKWIFRAIIGLILTYVGGLIWSLIQSQPIP